MIHRTFRSLDQAPKLVGFTLRQWLALIATAVCVLGLIHLTHLPGRPAITLCVFAVGLPAALTYVSESGGLQLGQLLGDVCRWRLCVHTLAPSSGECSSARGLIVLTPSDAQPEEACVPLAQETLDELLADESWDR